MKTRDLEDAGIQLITARRHRSRPRWHDLDRLGGGQALGRAVQQGKGAPVTEALDLAHVGEHLAFRERVILVAADVDERPEPGLAMDERDSLPLDLEPADLTQGEIAGRAKSTRTGSVPTVTPSKRAATAAAMRADARGGMRAHRSSKKPNRMSRSATAGGTPRTRGRSAARGRSGRRPRRASSARRSPRCRDWGPSPRACRC